MIFGRTVRHPAAFLALAALLGTVSAAYPGGARGCEVAVEGRGKVRRFPLPACAFELSWIHSVERTEWRETYVVDPAGDIVLTSSEFRSGGAGLPDSVGKGEIFRIRDGTMRIEGRRIRIGELRVLLSDVSHHRLEAGGTRVDLNAEFGEGRVTIRGVP